MKRLAVFVLLMVMMSGAALAQDKSREALEGYYPGYTMQVYQANEVADFAEAAYVKVEDGKLHVIRTEFTSWRKMPYVEECMPVPLSQELLRRLETEDMSSLLSLDGVGDFFLTEDGFDREVLPIAGKIIGSDLLEHELVLLMEEEDGTRRLWLVSEQDEGEYMAEGSAPLPADAYLDSFHAGPQVIQIDWMMEDGQTMLTVDFRRNAEGLFILDYVCRDNDLLYYAIFCGVETDDGFLIGNLPQVELFGTDWEKLSTGEVPAMDSDGWAVVNNPDPADRLHLRTEPSRKAASLGKFYNGTPVQVVDRKGEWVYVRIGYDGLEGWMMDEYLAFGDAMRSVERAWPNDLIRRDEVPADAVYPAMNSQDDDLRAISSEGWLVGLVEDEFYIVLTEQGECGYVPMDWMWEGNG